MARAPSFCAVILAAGESTRMGTDKALLPWPPQQEGKRVGDQTFLSAAIQSLNAVSDLVIVVAGKNEQQLAPIVYTQAAFLVRNPAPERGQFSSLQLGLQEVLNHGRDAAICTLVDRPPVSPATLSRLCEAFSTAADGTWALVPQYGGKHGHPVLWGREMISVLLDAPPTSNAREIEHRYQQHIQYFQVDDPTVAQNIDTPQDYATLSAPPSK
jgi:molybdenum cofactor cytidylyltransferase